MKEGKKAFMEGDETGIKVGVTGLLAACGEVKGRMLNRQGKRCRQEFYNVGP